MLNGICFCAAKFNAVAQHSARVWVRQLGEKRRGLIGTEYGPHVSLR